MCGICGFNFDNKELVKRMADSISHRGPNSEGFFVDKGISLGFRRLSIIDTSEKGNQPMITEDGRYVLIYKFIESTFEHLVFPLLVIFVLKNLQPGTNSHKSRNRNKK